MKPEFNIEQIREFVKKDYQSVAARFVKSALQIIDESDGSDREAKKESMERELYDALERYVAYTTGNGNKNESLVDVLGNARKVLYKYRESLK